MADLMVVVCAETGKLYACGWGQDGRLGLGRNEDQPEPVPVRALPEPVERIFAGGGHNFVQTADGRVFAFGLGLNGRLGLGTSPLALALAQQLTNSRTGNSQSAGEPTHLPFFDDKQLVSMAVGMDHTLAITVQE